jgi:dCTP deaminase
MLLNDAEIRALYAIAPFNYAKVRHYKGIGRVSYGCSSFGYDISLADHDFRIFKSGYSETEYPIIDPKKFDASVLVSEKVLTDDSGDYFIVPPLSSALGASNELFSIPTDVLCLCFSKSTYARCGLFTNITPLEPGWQGYLTLEIFNATSFPIKVYANEGIAQLVFFKGNQPEITYSGRYQNQASGVVTPGI